MTAVKLMASPTVQKVVLYIDPKTLTASLNTPPTVLAQE